MARNKKVEILSNEQEVLHPMTDGDCVIFEDGQTLTQKLSEDDSVKYTPEIVKSSPMFKVGEGNTVDYSDNVLDGAYERATLQGQTYVNYIQESSADEVTLPTPFTEYERTQHNTLTSDEEGTLGINLVGQSYVNALQHDSEEEYVVLGESLEFQEKKVEYTNEGQIKSAMLKGQTLVNLTARGVNLTGNVTNFTQENGYIKWNSTYTWQKVYYPIKDKPNTKYMVRVKDKHEQVGIYVRHDSTTASGTNAISLISHNLTGEQHAIFTSNETGVFAISLETADPLTDIWVQDFMIIEYQEGMENWDIPYFEGIQSVTVSTRLENLCHKQNSSTAKNGKTFNTNSLNDRLIVLNGVTDGGATSYGMKPNTKYLIQFKVSNLVLDGLSALALTFSTSTVDTGNCLFAPGTVENLVTSNGVYRVVLTTSNLISTSSVEIKGIPGQWENSGSSLRKMTISEIMYVEYQNGMENWVLPYFEDYQVMQPVQVESVNKNLFDGQLESGNIDTITGAYTTSAERQRTVNFIPVKPNTTYAISNIYETTFGIREYNKNKEYIGWYTATMKTDALTGTFTTTNNNDVSYVKIVIVNTYTDNQIQLEESSTATEYVPHQSKTTYSWDEVILRKIGDVEDTLDLTTGEWVQRIGEITYDGSDDEEWQRVNDYTEVPSGSIIFRTKKEDMEAGLQYQKICNTILGTLPIAIYDTLYNEGVDYDCMTTVYSIGFSTNAFYLHYKDINTMEEFRERLKTNPVKVQYVLTKPIVHKVNLSRPNLQVYDDITHVHTKCLDGTLIPNIYLPSDISYPAILEPGKAYNVSINHTEVSADNPLKVNVGGTEITMTDSRMTLTTPTTLANSNVSFTGKGNKIKESMLIKNSSLLTRDLPHFNGIGSVQLGKTIENLCSASGFKAGNSDATITWNDNYVHTKISNKAGSCVFVYELAKPLENGKKYFVYSPQTLDNSSCRASFRRVYNNSLSYARQQTVLPKNGKCIIEIDQTDNPYTHICVGCHHEIPLNTEFDLYRPIICEYEPGMENWDWESIGYFTGTKNIGNEFMRVQNKNLFTSKNLILGANQYWASEEYIINAGHTLRATLSQLIQVTPGCTLTLTFGSNYQGVIQEYIRDDKRTHYTDGGWQDGIHTLKLNEKTKYVNIYFRKKDDTQFTTDELNALKNSIQLEESSTATTYTAHKHNGLYITKDQPINLTWEQGRINPSGIGDSYTNAINNTVSYGIRTKGLLNLKPNTTYRISLGNKANFKYHIAVFDNWDNALPSVASLGISGDWISSVDTIFTTTKDAHKIGINVQKYDAGSITPPESVHAQVRLEEVTDIVLRSCSGKYDELDLTRGTYTQNVGRVYLDGINALSRLITIVGDSYQPTDTTLKTFDIRCDGAVVDSICLSNRFPMRESMASTNINFESVRIHSTAASCRLTISTKKASTLEEFKLWLQDNPLEIIYALKTPIIHKVHIGNKNEANTEVAKPNDVFTLPTLYAEQTNIELTNNGIMPKVQSRDYIAYPVLPMISRTYTLQHNLTGGVSNLTIDLLGRTQTITYQNHKSLVYSPETMDAVLHNELRISGKGKISRVMYIDGGYMDRDIPYIEGMKNAVNPIVKNIGKNLYKKDYAYLLHSNTYIATHDFATKPGIKIQRNTNYIMTFETTSPDTRIMGYSDGKKVTEYLAGNMLPSHTRFIFNSGNCNGLSFYRQVNTGLTLDYKVYLSEIDIDEPYKENICYVDCGEIRLTPDMFEQGSVGAASIGSHYNSDKNDSDYRIRTKELIKLEIGEQYVFLGNNEKYKYSARFYDMDGNKVNHSTPYDLTWKGTTPFTILNDAPMCAFFIAKMDGTKITVDDAHFNFQLVKVSEIKQLRSLPNGVHDEIDLETGKYIQRVGEITFNGTENWIAGYASWDNKRTYYNNHFVDIKTFKGDNGSGQAYYDALRCPQLHRSYMSRLASALIDGVCSYYYSGYQRIFISKQDCATVDELKLWLKENPITVQYELPEPIVKDIVIHNYPHSYEDGHVIIENGDPNTPIPAQLTYRAVTNRSGQIQQHTEQVEKQEREINELETLILANIHLSQTR